MSRSMHSAVYTYRLISTAVHEIAPFFI
jgi:hypothetical protein